MNRRDFLKAVSALGFMTAHPYLLYGSERRMKNLIHDINATVSYQRPSYWPVKWISIFLYGGPSELAGNLTNISEIDSASQNRYPDDIVPERGGANITTNYFWANAGGNDMEQLIADGKMSIYRTIHRIKDDNKSHPISIAQNLRGNLDREAPGFATTLAAILAANNPFGKDINELLLPFVSLEGDSQVYYLGDETIPLNLRPVFLNSNFDNPYSRKTYGLLDSYIDSRLEELALSMAQRYGLKKIRNAFEKRKQLADLIDSSLANLNDNLPTYPGTVDPNNPPQDVDPDTGKLVYPDTGIGNNLKAAVALCLEPSLDTVFVSISFGGWDNHSSAIGGYVNRVQSLMDALRCAVKHMEWSDSPYKDRVFITVFGDFGRNVNLNNSLGWDHGNTQNLYTAGGWGISGRSLGKLVGKTRLTGTPGFNRLFLKPTDDSYQCEPFSIVSTAYKYFGVQNPEVITGEPPIDESDSVPNEFQP